MARGPRGRVESAAGVHYNGRVVYGRRLPWLSLLAVVWAGSCSGGGDRSGVPDAGSRSYARVRVAITLPRQGDVGLATEARLMRYRDLDVEAAEILTGPPGPRPRASGPAAAFRSIARRSSTRRSGGLAGRGGPAPRRRRDGPARG